AVELRQHDVHDRGVVAALERLAQRLGPGRRHVDGVAGLAQSLRDEAGNHLIAFKDEDSHPSPDYTDCTDVKYRCRTYDCHAASKSAADRPRTPWRSALVSIRRRKASGPHRDTMNSPMTYTSW